MRHHAVVPFLIVLAGCTSPTEVRLGDTVMLQPGQSARIAGFDIEVTFLNVAADSRCPVDELILCVWEGDAHVVLRAQGASGTAELGVHTHREFGDTALFETFGIALDSLRPYPSSQNPPTQSQYRAFLRFFDPSG